MSERERELLEALRGLFVDLGDGVLRAKTPDNYREDFERARAVLLKHESGPKP